MKTGEEMNEMHLTILACNQGFSERSRPLLMVLVHVAPL